MENNIITDKSKTKIISVIRLTLVIIIFISCLITVKVTGLTKMIDIEEIRTGVENAGILGFIAYTAVFTVGEFIHIPGMVFVAGGILAYGRWLGFIATFAAAMVSISFSFLIIHLIGGKALKEIDRPFIKKILEKLDTRPIRIVIILRIIFWLAPALNYTLALTNLKYRDYIIGSIIGMAPIMLGVSIFFDYVLQYII